MTRKLKATLWLALFTIFVGAYAQAAPRTPPDFTGWAQGVEDKNEAQDKTDTDLKSALDSIKAQLKDILARLAALEDAPPQPPLPVPSWSFPLLSEAVKGTNATGVAQLPIAMVTAGRPDSEIQDYLRDTGTTATSTGPIVCNCEDPSAVVRAAQIARLRVFVPGMKIVDYTGDLFVPNADGYAIGTHPGDLFFPTLATQAKATGKPLVAMINFRNPRTFTLYTDSEIYALAQSLNAQGVPVSVWDEAEYQYRQGQPTIKAEVDAQGDTLAGYLTTRLSHTLSVIDAGRQSKPMPAAITLKPKPVTPPTTGRTPIGTITLKATPVVSTSQFTVFKDDVTKKVTVTVENKTITNTATGGRGISIEGSGFTIDKLIVRNCGIAAADYGLWLDGVVKELVLEDCTIESTNGGDNYPWRIYVKNVSATRCTFINPSGNAKANTRAMECDSFTATNCTFVGNRMMLGPGASVESTGPFKFTGTFNTCTIDVDSIQIYPDCSATFNGCDFKGTDLLVPWDRAKLLGTGNKNKPAVKPNATSTVQLSANVSLRMAA